MKKPIDLLKRIFLYIQQEYILSIIFLAAFFFRFYNFPLRYGFDYDALRDSLITRYSILHGVLPIIGPPTSMGDFPFGPWYYYLLDISAFLLRSIYSPWIAISLLSIGQIWIFYKIGKLLENKYLGYVFAALVALSSSQIVLATGVSNPNVIPFFATLTIYLSLLIVKHKVSWELPFFLGISLGMGVLSHYQMTGYFIFPVLVYLYKRKYLLRNILSTGLGIIIGFIPLIIFNILNHEKTFPSMLQYVIHGSASPVYVPNSWKIYLLHFWPSFWTYTVSMPVIMSTLCFVLTVGIIIYSLLREKKNSGVIIVVVAFLINFIHFRYFSGERVIYYEYYLQPFLFLFLGYALFTIAQFKNFRIPGMLLLLLVVIGMILQTRSQLYPKSSHITYNEMVQKLTAQYPDDTFSFYSCQGIEKYKTYSLVFTAEAKHKLGNGKKFGIYNPLCIANKRYSLSSFETNDGKIMLADLSKHNENELIHDGWIPVTPETIFNAITQWWQPDKKQVYTKLRINN